MFTPKAIDWITNIIGLLLAIAEPVNAYLISGEPFNGYRFAVLILTAIMAYFTGKSTKAYMLGRTAPAPDGEAKPIPGR